MFLRSCTSIIFFAILVFDYAVFAYFIDSKSRSSDLNHGFPNASNKDVGLYEPQTTLNKFRNKCPPGSTWFKTKCQPVLPNDVKSTSTGEARRRGDSTTSSTKVPARTKPPSVRVSTASTTSRSRKSSTSTTSEPDGYAPGIQPRTIFDVIEPDSNRVNPVKTGFTSDGCPPGEKRINRKCRRVIS